MRRHILILAMTLFAVPAMSQSTSNLADKFKPQGAKIDPIEQTLIETCPAGIWFDNRCRGQRFWKKLVPDGETFASAFGRNAKDDGTTGTAVLTTMADDATVRQYHLDGALRDKPRKRLNGLTATLQDAALPGAGHMFDYELLSRVTIVRGATDGYNSLYYEIATPKDNGDLTLYYSIFRRYGPSGSWKDTDCMTDAYIANSGTQGVAGCITTEAAPQSGGNTKDRSQCTASAEVGAAAASWAAIGTCGAGLGFITQATAMEAGGAVFAGVTVETANPILGGATAGATYGVVAGGGAVVTGHVCAVAGAVAEDVTGHVTGCVTSGLPATAQQVTDIYDWYALLDEAASEWLSTTGSCMVCNGSETETVGGGFTDDGDVWVEGELVCDDWTWVESETVEGELFCEQ